MLSKDKTPVLAGVIPVFEIFMTKWETLAAKRVWLKPFIDEGLRWAKKYYVRLDNTTAYIVAMCKCISIMRTSLIINFSFLVVNPSIRTSWITNNWEDVWKEDAIRQIKNLVRQLFNYFIFSTKKNTYYLDEDLSHRRLGRCNNKQQSEHHRRHWHERWSSRRLLVVLRCRI